MTACFHVSGVECDNCRTGLRVQRPESYTTDTIAVNNTDREIESLKAELELAHRFHDVAVKERDLYKLQVIRAEDIKKDYDSLEHDAARVILAHLNGDTTELDEAVDSLKSNGRHKWWEKYSPIGLRGDKDD